MTFTIRLYLCILCVVFISCNRQDTSVSKTEHVQILHDQINWDGYTSTSAQGEVIYVPIYSSVYHQSGRTFDLTATLSVHNVDLNNTIRLIRVNYYNTDGRLIRKYIKDPISIRPFQTKQFVISSVDTTGGTGANFIVQWISETRVTPPITEAVMIATAQGQGLSFSTQGKVIDSIHP